MILVDTTLLIDLERGLRNPRRQEAEAWLAANPNETLGLPAIVLGEFGEGFQNADDPQLMKLRTSFQILPVDALVASKYSELSRSLRMDGKSIGANDTWIAATALANGYRLLTRNVGHFERVPDLEVVCYAT